MIEEQVAVCKRCNLGKYRLYPCFGNGNPETDIMFIGEGPGYEEDHSGIVFIGKAGKLLDELLKKTLNLTRQAVYITNIVKCHPMSDPESPHKRGNDRPPSPEEVRECMFYLSEQIKHIKPKVIVTLGSPATKTMLNTDKGITGLRGKIFELKFGGIDVKIVPAYHPAYLLRSPSKKPDFVNDLELIGTLL